MQEMEMVIGLIGMHSVFFAKEAWIQPAQLYTSKTACICIYICVCVCVCVRTQSETHNCLGRLDGRQGCSSCCETALSKADEHVVVDANSSKNHP